MTISLRDTLRNARADAIATDVGSAGICRIYSGTVPANVGTALGAQVVLAELTCATPFAPSASGGVLTAGSITQDTSANATGTASFFRIFKSDGTTAVIQGSVTATGGGGDMTLNTVSVVITGAVQVTSCVSTEA